MKSSLARLFYLAVCRTQKDNQKAQTVDSNSKKVYNIIIGGKNSRKIKKRRKNGIFSN
jgi:hypothetical protein